MNTEKTISIIKKKRGPKPGQRSEYNKFVKEHTMIVRNKYELKPRKEQHKIVLEMWEKRKKIKSKIYDMCPTANAEEVEHLAKVIEEMEKEEW